MYEGICWNIADVEIEFICTKAKVDGNGIVYIGVIQGVPRLCFISIKEGILTGGACIVIWCWVVVVYVRIIYIRILSLFQRWCDNSICLAYLCAPKCTRMGRVRHYQRVAIGR